eukprot:2308372-Pleurochrysis_carterae.AAC.5
MTNPWIKEPQCPRIARALRGVCVSRAVNARLRGPLGVRGYTRTRSRAQRAGRRPCAAPAPWIVQVRSWL